MIADDAWKRLVDDGVAIGDREMGSRWRKDRWEEEEE